MTNIVEFRSKADRARYPISLSFDPADLHPNLVEWLVEQLEFADFRATKTPGLIHAATMEDAIYLKMGSHWPVEIEQAAINA